MNELFGPQGAALALMIAAVTQTLKEGFGLEGKQAKILSLGVGAGLGILLGLFGLQGEASRLLPGAPLWLAAGLIGLLLGVVAQGGYSMVTWLQDREVAKRAQAEAEQGLKAPEAAAIPVIGLMSEIPSDDVEIDPTSPLGRQIADAQETPLINFKF